MDCITFTADGEERELRARLSAPAGNADQALYVGGPLKTGRIMAKDEDVCLHCGLCAERCPTGAWDMQKFLLAMPSAGPSGRPEGRPRTAAGASRAPVGGASGPARGYTGNPPATRESDAVHTDRGAGGAPASRSAMRPRNTRAGVPVPRVTPRLPMKTARH
jgi:ferredoxin